MLGLLMTRSTLTRITATLYRTRQDMALHAELWKVLKAGPSHPKCEIELTNDLIKRIEKLEL